MTCKHPFFVFFFILGYGSILCASPPQPAVNAEKPSLVAEDKPVLVAEGQLTFVAEERPTEPVDPQNCTTSDCHAKQKDFPLLHGPMNINTCEACHVSDKPTEHTFTLARSKSELCTFCHELKIPENSKLHEPVAKGDCLGCHNPHGGFDRSFTRSEDLGETCASCHQNLTHDKKNVHGPVAAGACVACHAPHSSPNPKLLLNTGRELCLSCHQEMDHQLKGVQFVHEAVKGDCTDCHDPHASNFNMMLKESPKQLCTKSCHIEIKQAVEKAPHKHSAVIEGDGCVNCHNAHGGDLAKLMKTTPAKICLSCHNKKIKTKDGRTIVSVSEILDPTMKKHGPVAEGSCGGCHNVHGSEVAHLLQLAYPARFYTPFEHENYALCFECHDSQLVELKRTDSLTQFREGDVNLHYLHVNKDKRGRTCRACHTVHASKNNFQLRDSVPYGRWELPVGYKPTENGGSCAPGCHKPFEYNRTHENVQMIEGKKIKRKFKAPGPPDSPESPGSPGSPGSPNAPGDKKE